MRKRLFALVLALALVAAACGDDDDDTAAGGEGGGGGAETFAVQVDGRTDDTPMFFFAYFPSALQARPGDTIEFEFADTGEPHTVSLGSVVDTPLEILATSGFDPEGDAPPPPELEEAFNAVPFVFPEGPPEQGLNQGPSQPCYLASGTPPVEEPCETQEQSPFTGTEALYSSGFVPGGESWSMTLADDAAPGTYNFMCLVHGPEMTGTIEVVAEGTEVPSPDDVAAEGRAALDAAVAQLQPVADEVRAITDPAGAQAGGFSEELEFVGAVSVFPDEISIGVGESVTWSIFGPHTVSFNAPESARPIVVVDADGTVGLNPEAGAPAGWEGPPPPPEGEGDGPPEGPVPVDAGSWDGSGFHNSSVLFDPMQYTLTFTTAGTYEYLCLVHPDMEGTIKVG